MQPFDLIKITYHIYVNEVKFVSKQSMLALAARKRWATWKSKADTNVLTLT